MFGPTPIEKLSRLSKQLGGKVELYAKREDCNSGLAFGGKQSKEARVPHPRRAGAGLRHARDHRRRTVQPHPASRSSRGEARAQMPLGAGETGVPFNDAVYDRVGNILMSRVLGAEIELVDEGFDIGIRESWENALEDVRAKGGKPYPIPAGASDHPLGGLGFVGFAEEVRQQETEMGFVFDYIVVCTVTGSTHAGMLVGFAADGRARNVIGIDASATPEQTHAQVLRIAQNTAEKVELGQENICR